MESFENKYGHLLKIHICGKINEAIIKNVFPDPCNQKIEDQKIGDWQWKTEQFNWIAKIYNKILTKIILNQFFK